MRVCPFEAGNILRLLNQDLLILWGLEMYSQLLEEAIAKKQGKEQKDKKVMQKLNLKLMLIYQVIIYQMNVKN